MLLEAPNSEAQKDSGENSKNEGSTSSETKENSKSSKQDEETFYKDMEYSELVDKIFKIRQLPAAKKVLRVLSAQKRYNLPHPSACKGKKYNKKKDLKKRFSCK